MAQKKFYICSTSEGCAVNLNESSTIVSSLLQEGYQRCLSSDEASIIVINTCAVNQSIEDKTAAFLAEMKAKHPNTKIVTTGCFPAINPKRYHDNYSFPYVSPKNLAKMNESLGIDNILDIRPSSTFDEHHQGISHHQVFDRIRKAIKRPIIRKFIPSKLQNLLEGIVYNADYHTLTIGTGCMGDCTYCAIKVARGKAVSRSKQDIINSLAQTTNDNIWILSGDVGCWGVDLNTDVSELLEDIYSVGSHKFIINYFGPEWLEKYEKKIISFFTNQRLKYIGIPIQSGSQQIIDASKRYYDVANVLKIIDQIKRQNRSLIIKTDVIVGLPGESWKDFFKTVKALFHFDTVYAQPYSIHKSIGENMKMPKSNHIKLKMVLIRVSIGVRHLITLFSCYVPRLAKN